MTLRPTTFSDTDAPTGPAPTSETGVEAPVEGARTASRRTAPRFLWGASCALLLGLVASLVLPGAGSASNPATAYVPPAHDENGRLDVWPFGYWITVTVPYDTELPAAGELGGPRVELEGEELERFLMGRQAFLLPFTIEQGRGPYWEEVSCASCHFDPVIGGTSGGRFVVVGPGPAPDFETEHYPAHALPGFPARPAPPNATVNRPRPLFGLGMIAEVPDSVIIAGCDPEDADGDGVRGRAALDDDPTTPGVHRFGVKAHEESIRDFAQNALFDDFNITSGTPGMLPDDFYGVDDDDVTDPEVTEPFIDLLDAYVRGLAPPPRLAPHPEGEAVFGAIGCAQCHRRDLGPQAPGSYTNLCLHDMGPELGNGIADKAAGPNDFRTPPLWGLRFQPHLMHSGEAESPHEAIELHGGEAAAARERYRQLSADDRRALLEFLDTL